MDLRNIKFIESEKEYQLIEALENGMNRLLKEHEKEYLKWFSEYDNEASGILLDWIKELSRVRKGNLGKERIGLKRKNNYGSEMEIVKYEDANNIWVKFSNGNNLIHSQWTAFCDGKVRNPLDKSVFGIGCIGEGEYIATKKGINSPQYLIWNSMMRRAYSENFSNNNPTYKEVTVCEDWHNFQIFAKWYDENYYEVKGEKMSLDKDILVKGNKLYSPETCMFAPQRINSLFIKTDSLRGDLPIGVKFENNKYQSNCNINGIKKYLGTFDNLEDAFNAYKFNKEKYIKEVAEVYKENVPKKLYEAMINYQVEKTD